MTKQKLNFDIIFEEIKKQKKDKNAVIDMEEIKLYDEIRELSEIVSEVQEPENMYFTTT